MNERSPRDLATCRASELDPRSSQPRWLVQDLWGDESVGVLGGEPKSFKSFLALELAVSVASSSPCLGRFPTLQPGPVLLFAAEDALHVVRNRLEGIASAHGVPFPHLDVHVIIEPALRIDLGDDRQRLGNTVDRVQPRLLILDPFVRTHRVDENVVADVAPLLAFLREIQRRSHTAVLLVHHARKASHARPGQALRGSSEFHAWGDSNLYLRRKDDLVTLTVEHRAAPAPMPLTLQLHTRDGSVALGPADPVPEPEPIPVSDRDRILHALATTSGPMTQRALRQASRMRTTTVGKVIAGLLAEGTVLQGPDGYRLTKS